MEFPYMCHFLLFLQRDSIYADPPVWRTDRQTSVKSLIFYGQSVRLSITWVDQSKTVEVATFTTE